MKHQQQQGFALVVIAALFIAFSVIAAVVVERNSITAQFERHARARDQLSRIANAMVNYSLVNRSSFNPFPCPARLDLTITDPNFGVPLSNCQTGGTATAGVDLLPTRVDGTSTILRGMVPVRALGDYGINTNDAIDPWNNRIMYVVQRNLTPNSAGAPNPGSAGMSISNFVGGGVAANGLIAPDFILISYGPDGRGAYPKARTSITVNCATTPSGGIATGNNPRDFNCGDQITGASAFTRRPANTSNAATAATYFDDIIAYYSR